MNDSLPTTAGAVSQGLEIARSVSDLGATVVLAGFAILTGIAAIILLARWLKRMMDDALTNNQRLLADNQQMLTSLTQQVQQNNDIMRSVSESLRPETQLRIKTLSNLGFDLLTHQVLSIIHTVSTENHITDRAATRKKIRKLTLNQVDDLKSKYDLYTYLGRKLSAYMQDDYALWIAETIEGEVYADTPNDARCHTAVNTLIARIKLDFYHQLNAS